MAKTSTAGGWVIGRCASCSGEARAHARACPSCGIQFQAERPSQSAWVFCMLSWLAAVGGFFVSTTVMGQTLAAVIGVGGIAWLSALRDWYPIKGMIVVQGAALEVVK